jgi:ATP synthase subunit 6
MNSPLEQFKLVPYIRLYNNYYDLTISNYTYFLFISTIFALFIIYNSKYIISNKREKIGEILYIKIEEIIRDMIGKTKYLPLIFSLFIFVLLNNLLGLIPYSFTVTSHIIYTGFMSLSIIIGITILGFSKHKWNFFSLFVPAGLSQSSSTKYIIPLIFIIEIISYISRIISLAVRLTANMISGHLLLHIITNFGVHISLLLFSLPLLLLFPIYILEFAVALIQSYVFIILTISYIKDIEYLH